MSLMRVSIPLVSALVCLVACTRHDTVRYTADLNADGHIDDSAVFHYNDLGQRVLEVWDIGADGVVDSQITRVYSGDQLTFETTTDAVGGILKDARYFWGDGHLEAAEYDLDGDGAFEARSALSWQGGQVTEIYHESPQEVWALAVTWGDGRWQTQSLDRGADGTVDSVSAALWAANGLPESLDIDANADGDIDQRYSYLNDGQDITTAVWDTNADGASDVVNRWFGTAESGSVAQTRWLNGNGDASSEVIWYFDGQAHFLGSDSDSDADGTTDAWARYEGDPQALADTFLPKRAPELELPIPAAAVTSQ